MKAPGARESIDYGRRWAGQAARVLDGRGRIADTAARATAELVQRTVPVKLDGEVAWRVLPVDRATLLRGGEMVRHRWLTRIGMTEAKLIDELAGPAATAVRETWAAEGWRRFFSRAEARASADRAVAYSVTWWGGCGAVTCPRCSTGWRWRPPPPHRSWCPPT